MSSDFNTTHWSLIEKIRSEDSKVATVALETLCRSYWLPLYAWLRGSGNSEEESKDLVQGFFLYAIRKNIFQKAESERGKLRSFLLVCLKRYLADENEKAAAQKRLGRKNEISLSFVDPQVGEEGIERALTSLDATPSEIYDYRWARTLLQIALYRLETEYETRGKGELYHVLRPLLTDSGKGKFHADAATKLKSSEGAVRIAFHRFKKRFREIVREEVAKTLLPGETIDDEMQILAGILSGTGKEKKLSTRA